LRAIARNRSLDKLRAAGRRPQLVALGGGAEADGDAGLDRMGPDIEVVGGSAVARGPEDAALAADERRRVGEALASMPDDERMVIVLAYRDQLTQQEIAARLGWPLGTVKTRTRRALGRLRVILAPDDQLTAVEPAREDHDGSR
jgi:RNA polymerase sigma factor (sigma-70 family)